MIPTLREAAQAALDALETLGGAPDDDVCPIVWVKAKGWPICEALRSALAAQPVPDARPVQTLTDAQKLTMYGTAMMRPKSGPMTSMCWYAAGIEDAEAAHGISAQVAPAAGEG